MSLKLNGLTVTNAINGSVTGNAATVTTNANLTGHITSTGNATILGSFTSAQLLAALTDETGTGANVFATSPTLVSPALGTPTSGVLTNCTGTAEGLIAGMANELNDDNTYFVTSLTATSQVGTKTTNIGANLERGDATDTTLNFASDNFRFYASGTGGIGETLRITEGGRIGIGTSSPNYLTDIQSTTSPLTLNLKLSKASTTNDYAEIAFQLWSGASSGANTFGGAGTSRPGVVLRALNENGSSAAGAFIVGTFTGGADNSTLTEKFRITSTGNIGIGTTTPSAKLHVYNGSSHFETTSTGAAVISSGLYALQIGPLHDRIQTAGSYYGGIAFNHLLNFNGVSTYNGAPQAWIGTRLQDDAGSERDYLVFATKPGTGTTGAGNDIPVERMCIDRDGLVGIGTTSPIAPLDVQCNTGGTGIILRGRADNSTALRFYANNGTTQQLYIGTDDSNIDFVSVSTRPIRFFVNSLLQHQISQLGVFSWKDGGGGDRMTLNSTGLGIGTTIPAVNLHVRNASSGDQTLLVLEHAAGYSAGTENRLDFYDDEAHKVAARIAQYYTNEAGNRWGLKFYTNSSTAINSTPALTLMGNNNVGIGTTVPAARLHINSTTSGATLLRTDGTSGTLFSVVDDLSDSLMSVNNSAGLPVLEVFADDRIVGGQYGKNDFVVVNNKVGIGTNNPANKLTVSGSTSIGESYINTTAPSNGLIVQGNVGIGTTSPGTLLQVHGSNPFVRISNSAAGDHGIKITYGTSETHGLHLLYNANSAISYIDNTYPVTSGQVYGDIYFRQNVAGTMTTRMTIKGDGGNVGIGTTSPNSKLDIRNGNLELSDSSFGNVPEIRFTANSSGRYVFAGIKADEDNAYNGHLEFWTTPVSNNSTAANAAFAERMRITSTGNVGIGTTSPTAKLVVMGDDVYNYTKSSVPTAIIADDDVEFLIGTTDNFAGEEITLRMGSVLNTYYDKGAYVKAIQGANVDRFKLAFGTSDGATATTKMTIANDGNVGIGSTSPTQKLDVNGTVLATAFSGPLTGNVTGTATTADSLNQNNNYTVSGFRANGSIYSGNGNSSYGGFQLNNDSHGLRRQDQTNDVYCYTTSGTLYLGAGGSSTTHIRVLSGGDVGIGVSPSYKLDVNGSCHATCFPTSSDIRFKKKITPLENSLEKIKKLQGVKYEWNEFVNSRRDGYKLNVPIIGLIAQDVEKVIPEIIDVWKLSDDCQDARSIEYPRLIPFLIEAIKDQQDQIEDLKNRLTVLENK